MITRSKKTVTAGRARPKKMRDHSIKAYRVHSWIEDRGRIDVVRRVIQRAGFPVEVIGPVETAVVFHAQSYHAEIETRAERPRAREVANSLKAVIEAGRAFDVALGCLSNRTRLAIMDADVFRHRDQWPADSFRLAQRVRHFVDSAYVALLQTPDDRGGPSEDRSHINFAFRLSILWRLYHSDSGIRKHGTQGTFTGPLLEFVEQILKLEGAAYRNGSGRFRSRMALGKALHQYRKRAEQCAREQLDNRAQLSAPENAGQ